MKSSKGRNKVLRYGSKLPYNAPMQGKIIPWWLDGIIQRLTIKDHLRETPDHVTINEYQIGQSIDWHVDSKTSGPIITVLSLNSDAIMLLRDKNDHTTRRVVILPARSLLTMDGIERWDWEHTIEPVPDLRYSIVFRKGTK